jgi:hypothetical protein
MAVSDRMAHWVGERIRDYGLAGDPFAPGSAWHKPPMSTAFTISDDYHPDGNMSPNADPITEYRTYLSHVGGGMVGDMGFSLADF